MITMLIILIIIGLCFDYMNGFNDGANIVATMIVSRALPSKAALLLASVAVFIGPFLLGTAVAKTIGTGIINNGVGINMIISAMIGAIAWGLFTGLFGIPSSSSHALIGGLVGSAIMSSGINNINSNGILKILLVLFTSPIIGFVSSFIFSKILHRLTINTTPKINKVFKSMQIVSSAVLALGYGANDAQKTMGLITMGLVILKFQNSFIVPTWVILICVGALALGITTGGFRIIKKVGSGIFKIQPIHGFSVQCCSSAVIVIAALIGGPVSTTHIVSSSIVGVGTSTKYNHVRWNVVQDILITWLLTLPAAGIMGAIAYKLLSLSVAIH